MPVRKSGVLTLLIMTHIRIKPLKLHLSSEFSVYPLFLHCNILFLPKNKDTEKIKEIRNEVFRFSMFCILFKFLIFRKG